MLRNRRYQNRGGLKFAKSDTYGHIVDAGGGGGYDIGNYDYTKKSDHGIHDSGGYGHSGGGGYGHSSGGGYGHSGGGYGHSDGGYGHESYSYDGDGYGHSVGGYGHENYGGYGHASYGSYGKMDCPGVPIALLLTTLLGIAGRTLLQLIIIIMSKLNIKLLNLTWLLEA